MVSVLIPCSLRCVGIIFLVLCTRSHSFCMLGNYSLFEKIPWTAETALPRGAEIQKSAQGCPQPMTDYCRYVKAQISYLKVVQCCKVIYILKHPEESADVRISLETAFMFHFLTFSSLISFFKNHLHINLQLRGTQPSSVFTLLQTHYCPCSLLPAHLSVRDL